MIIAPSVSTVLFFPLSTLKGAYQILKPGGTFLIVNESDGMKAGDDKWLSAIDGLRIFNQAQLSGFLEEAGFSDITVYHNQKKHWLCVLAMREDS